MNLSGKMKHVEAHEYARKSEREMTVAEFQAVFKMPYESAFYILCKYGKHKIAYSTRKPFTPCLKPCRHCSKTFLKTRRHHNCCSPECKTKRQDAYVRRAATRERIRQNKAKAVQS